MKLIVTENGKLALADADNFRGFHIEPAPVLGDAWASAAAFAAIAGAADEPDHFWLDADAVAQLGAGPDWQEKFWAMLKKVEPYGFADLTRRRIKAHVVRSGSL